jgi:mono/diheme cytochrome c family protein
LTDDYAHIRISNLAHHPVIQLKTTNVARLCDQLLTSEEDIMKRILFIFLLLPLTILLSSACSDSQPESADEQDQGVAEAPAETAEEEAAHTHVDAPDEFESLTNPFAGDGEAIAAGKAIFEDKCAECHGPEGKGDGPEAVFQNPKPADLSDTEMMSGHSDGYLFWRVTKGGFMEPFNSGMKAFEMALDDDERWQVVTYVRTLSE